MSASKLTKDDLLATPGARLYTQEEVAKAVKKLKAENIVATVQNVVDEIERDTASNKSTSENDNRRDQTQRIYYMEV